MQENYDLNEPTSYILYLDTNNLYGTAMSEPLPRCDFKLLTEDEASSIDCVFGRFHVDSRLLSNRLHIRGGFELPVGTIRLTLLLCALSGKHHRKSEIIAGTQHVLGRKIGIHARDITQVYSQSERQIQILCALQKFKVIRTIGNESNENS